ncbi:MAG: DEAD/DEAH box helicase [Solobacterium sp.]|nr:DEAD/DEAH box helicase [Solobacterium sp.]
MELYEWQNECLNAWVENHDHGMINFITGAGKTVLALVAMQDLFQRFPNTQIRIIVPTVTLAKQWQKEILNFDNQYFPAHYRIGLYYGEIKNDPALTDIVIYVINSARSSVSRHILDGFHKKIHQFLICDECHHYGSEFNRLIFRFLELSSYDNPLYHSLGLSATPQSANYQSVLVPSLGKEIYHYGLDAAAERNSISPFALIHVKVSFTIDEREDYAEIENRITVTYHKLLKLYPDLKGKSIQELFTFLSPIAEEDPDSLAAHYCNLIKRRRALVYFASNRRQCVNDLLSKKRPDEKVILFSERISQAEEIYDDLKRSFPNDVTIYHSQMPSDSNKYSLDSFRMGETHILVACKALDEGLDVPDASIGIVISSTSVTRQRLQRLGRIIRKKEDKPLATLYYLHIYNSIESSVYFKDTLPIETIVNMKYNSAEHSFHCDEYEDLIYQLSIKYPSLFDDPILRKEMMECFEEANGRSDWLYQPQQCDPIIKNAESRHEKNYWICMKRLSLLRANHMD